MSVTFLSRDIIAMNGLDGGQCVGGNFTQISDLLRLLVKGVFTLILADSSLFRLIPTDSEFIYEDN